MFAMVDIAGRQYRVAPQEELAVDRLDAQPGSEYLAGRVLMVADGDKCDFGTPTLPYTVKLEVLRHDRHAKVLSYHFKRRGGRRRLWGHRQQFTVVRVKSIEKAAE